MANTHYKVENNQKAITALLIFLGGFTNGIIPILITFMSKNYHLSHWKAVLLQSTFFINFFITVFPGWILIKRYGYKSTILSALLVCAISSAAFALALETKNHFAFFPVIFILAFGITLIRISVTPLLITNQQSSQYHKYISLIMCSDTVGALISPTFSSYWLLNPENHSQLQSATYFFIGLSIAYLILASFIQKRPFGNNTISHSIDKKLILNATKSKIIQSGFLATFLFIGLEFSIPIFMASLAQNNNPDNPHIGALLISCYWSLLLIGRLLSTKVLQALPAKKMMIYGSTISISIILVTMQSTYFAYWLTLLGLINSYMYPCIFSIHTKQLPTEKHFIASSIFLMGFSGGAFVPFLQALIAKSSSTEMSFFLIILCYFSMTQIIRMTQSKIDKQDLESAHSTR